MSGAMHNSKAMVSDLDEEATAASTVSKRIKREISWPAVLFYIHLSILALVGLYIMYTESSLKTVLFTAFLTFLGVLGATAGAHRLWAHRTYKATGALRVFLMVCQTLTGWGSIYSWVQAHRLHHKMFRKEQDPFCSAYDFFSAHVLAQVYKYTPEQLKLLEEIDMSDLEDDRVVMFQKKFYWILYIVVHVLLPINTPFEYWGDSMPSALFVTFSLRYFVILNVCWLINSSHLIWGLDKNVKPTDSNLVFFITRSYWPQYHYLLPQDYQCGEFGNYNNDLITSLICVFAVFGLATDLRTISSISIKAGLTNAVETGRSVVDCISEQITKEMENVPCTPFVNREKFF